jgi:hypothetical protein
MTNQQRFEAATAYLHANFPDIETTVGKLSLNRTEELGAELNLPALNWFGQSDSKKNAVRALLLCQVLLLPKCNRDTTRTYFRAHGEDDVKSAIECYTTLPNATINGVAQAALTRSIGGNRGLGTVTRKTPNWSEVCYSAVLYWLFQAGFVSLPKFAAGFPLGESPNRVLGYGIRVQSHVNWANEFQKGEIFNFHPDNMPGQNHWGVALGGDEAVAVNNGPKRNELLRKAGSLTVLSNPPDHTRFSLWACANACKGRSLYNLDSPEAQGQGRYLVIRRINPANHEGLAFDLAA